MYRAADKVDYERKSAMSVDMVHAETEIETGCSLSDRLSALSSESGMQHFLLAAFPRGDKPEFSSNHIVSNWPRALREAYEATDAFGFSRVVRHLKDSAKPLFTVDPVFANAMTGDAGAAPGLFSQPGFTGHLCFSMHDAATNQYLVVYSGAGKRLDDKALAALYLGTLDLIDTVASEHPHDGPREKLSARELECLRWSAAGKSSDEIAMILSISGHTVISYLKSAMRKLDSVNRMQAIARACRFRLL